MDATTLRRYHELRRGEGGRPMGASYCLMMARYEAEARRHPVTFDAWEWLPEGGEYLASMTPDDDREDECPLTFDEAYEYARDSGASRDTARRWALADLEHSQQERETWGVEVRFRLGNLPEGSASLWGIDFYASSSWYEMQSYLRDVVRELVDEARHHTLAQALPVAI